MLRKNFRLLILNKKKLLNSFILLNYSEIIKLNSY
jgi:hypothetical protein